MHAKIVQVRANEEQRGLLELGWVIVAVAMVGCVPRGQRGGPAPSASLQDDGVGAGDASPASAEVQSAAEDSPSVGDQFVFIGGTSGEPERAKVLSWIKEANGVLRSDLLLRNLRSLSGEYPDVFLRGGVKGTMGDVADVISLRSDKLRYMETPLALVGGTFDSTASTGWTGDPLGNGASMTSMSLGRLHLKRFLSKDVVERSCAINTMAHEMSHLISTDPKLANSAFTDTGKELCGVGGLPLASYVVGSTAQCTWLQEQGRVEKKEAALVACVQAFGYEGFNSLRCDKFGQDQVVQERDGLPERATLKVTDCDSG